MTALSYLSSAVGQALEGWTLPADVRKLLETAYCRVKSWTVTETDAEHLGRTGAPATEAERLLFEAYMRGHCWKVSGVWNGATYVGVNEHPGYIDPQVMDTRRLWAVWRDRAALAPQAEEGGLS